MPVGDEVDGGAQPQGVAVDLVALHIYLWDVADPYNGPDAGDVDPDHVREVAINQSVLARQLTITAATMNRKIADLVAQGRLQKTGRVATQRSRVFLVRWPGLYSED